MRLVAALECVQRRRMSEVLRIWAAQAFHVRKSCVTFEIQNINTPDTFVQLRELRLREVMRPTD